MNTELADPQQVARRIARRHDENFPVAFLLLPGRLRADMRAVYAFCRGVDDIGDEAGAAGVDPRVARLALLAAFERDLLRCWDGAPEDPRLRALSATIRRHRLQPEPFLRLVEANRMDQRTSRWGTYGELIDYCRHSATPVGRLVLTVLGRGDAERVALSDHTCIGLQLVNLWQDIRRDLEDRDRIYLPAEDMARFDVTEDDVRRPRATEPMRRLVAFEVTRARAELVAGAPLWRMVPWRARIDIRMFTAGGLGLCDAIARQGFDTLAHRPAPGRLGRARIACDVILRMARGAA